MGRLARSRSRCRCATHIIVTLIADANRGARAYSLFGSSGDGSKNGLAKPINPLQKLNSDNEKRLLEQMRQNFESNLQHKGAAEGAWNEYALLLDTMLEKVNLSIVSHHKLFSVISATPSGEVGNHAKAHLLSRLVTRLGRNARTTEFQQIAQLYEKQGDLPKLRALFSEMKAANITPTTNMFNILLRATLKAEDYPNAFQIFALLRNSQGNKLVNENAQPNYPPPNSSTYHAVIMLLANSNGNNFVEAYEAEWKHKGDSVLTTIQNLVSEMKSVDIIPLQSTLCILLNLQLRMGQYEQVIEGFKEMSHLYAKTGVRSLFQGALTIFVSTLCRANRWVEAKDVVMIALGVSSSVETTQDWYLNEIPQEHMPIANLDLIHGTLRELSRVMRHLSETGSKEEAERVADAAAAVFRVARDHGLVTKYSYSVVVTLLAECPHRLQEAMDLWTEAAAAPSNVDLMPSRYSLEKLMDALCKNGSFEQAFDVFSIARRAPAYLELLGPRIYVSMILGCTSGGLFHEASAKLLSELAVLLKDDPQKGSVIEQTKLRGNVDDIIHTICFGHDATVAQTFGWPLLRQCLSDGTVSEDRLTSIVVNAMKIALPQTPPLDASIDFCEKISRLIGIEPFAAVIAIALFRGASLFLAEISTKPCEDISAFIKHHLLGSVGWNVHTLLQICQTLLKRKETEGSSIDLALVYNALKEQHQPPTHNSVMFTMETIMQSLPSIVPNMNDNQSASPSPSPIRPRRYDPRWRVSGLAEVEVDEVFAFFLQRGMVCDFELE